MRYEAQVLIYLTDRDVRLASPNGGLTVELPPGTTKVIIKVEREGEEEAKSGSPRPGCLDPRTGEWISVREERKVQGA